MGSCIYPIGENINYMADERMPGVSKSDQQAVGLIVNTNVEK